MWQKYFFILLLYGTQVFGYVPPSSYLAGRALNQYKSLKNLYVKNRVHFVEDEEISDTHFIEKAFFDTRSGRLTIFVLDEKDQTLYQSSRILKAKSGLLELLLYSSDKDIFLGRLKDYGIPVVTEEELTALSTEEERRQVEKTFLRRSDQNFSWVIGNSAGVDQDSAQLWLKKDSFLAERVIFSGDPSDRAEYWFGQYSFRGEFKFPGEIKFLRGGMTQIYSKLEDLKVNLKKVPRINGRSGMSTVGRSASSDVRDLIKRYYRLEEEK